MSATRACDIARDRMTARLRAALANINLDQTRDYEALREEGETLRVAGWLADSDLDLDGFAIFAAASPTMRLVLDKARRWRAIRTRRDALADSAALPSLPSESALPFPIGRNDVAVERTAEALTATGETVRSFLSPIGVPARACSGEAAGPNFWPSSGSAADPIQGEAR